MNVFQLNTREQLYLFCDTLNHHEFLSFFLLSLMVGSLVLFSRFTCLFD